MKMIKLNKEQVYQGNLLLVNAQHPYKDSSQKRYIPVDDCFPEIVLKHDAANALRLILEKIPPDRSIVPVSGYRSLEEQKDIYDASLEENGEEFTRKYVALPDHSEHQTGLAIDLGLNKQNIDFICPDFPYEGVCDAFRKAAPDYGFIQRYTEDKEKITGISHEPWHFRYVGYPHSKIMEERGLSFEEYIEFLKSYRYNCRFVFCACSGTEIEIYYVPVSTRGTLLILPGSDIYQISGNNIDGCIVTVWRNTNECKLYGN